MDPDKYVYCYVSTTAPRCLLFLLPYPLVYLMPMYMSMAALQRAEEPKLRAFWWALYNHIFTRLCSHTMLNETRLSYWACLVGMDLVEMAVLGTWAQALLYWPGVRSGRICPSKCIINLTSIFTGQGGRRSVSTNGNV